MNSTLTQFGMQSASATKTAISPSPPKTISRESIAELAYQKWQRRGRPMGDDLKDWVEAEAELKSIASSRKRYR